MNKTGEKKYSLILLDISMPDYIDGARILPGIIAGYPDIPVIMLTGTLVEEDKRKKYLNEGAVDYLEKTMPTEQLINSIRKALNKKEFDQIGTVRWPDIAIDHRGSLNKRYLSI